MSLTVIGTGLSPFVRKVRVFLAEKNVQYENEPLVPFNVSDEFKQISPLGKIPVLRDGERTLPDSSVICTYLERKHPEPSLYPADDFDFARALWFEEFADTRLVEKTAPVFGERIVNKLFLKQPCDEDRVKQLVDEEMPPCFDYLEGEIGDAEYLVGGRFSIADIATAGPFVNLSYAGVELDAGRWPRLAGLVARVWARPSFKALIEEGRKGLPG